VLTQVGYNCGMRAPLEVGGAAIVIGDGLVGQWAAQTLAWRGAQVVLVGHHEDRLARFAEGPGRYRLYAGTDDWADRVRETLPRGIDVLVDTVGSIEVVEALQPQMRHHGYIVSAGFYGTADRLALQPLRTGEQTVCLVSGWTTERIDATLELVSVGYLETLPLITHHFPVHRAGDAWKLIGSKGDDVLGVILDW
jgi:threonine dehydrogenase-like Zn-dependent dehydrogenase